MKETNKAYNEFRSGRFSLDDVYKVMCQEIVNETGATRPRQYGYLARIEKKSYVSYFLIKGRLVF